MSNRWIVITSINRPTRAIEVVSELCAKGWRAVVVGDTKTPGDWAAAGVDFLSVDRQKADFGALADLIPYRHYCRKNLGYLHAIRQGADMIIDTDDDNIPYTSFGQNLALNVTGEVLSGGTSRDGWVNIYPHFTADKKLQIWPRGLPLDSIYELGTKAGIQTKECLIQQFLADNDPDVDAIFRLTTRGEFFFEKGAKPIILDKGCWVPFNSQNTVYYAGAFELLYLPCYVSFRMTDIWRSFVAQAALWHRGGHVSFHEPTVEQIRNVHDLMKDFADEVDGYLQNRKIGRLLMEGLEKAGASLSLAELSKHLWRALAAGGILPEKELPVIEAWLEALEGAKRAGKK